MSDTFMFLNVGRRTVTRNFLKMAAAFVFHASFGWATAVNAQAYPDRPISLRVAFPAGGPADASFRAAGVVLERRLGQALIVENTPGANGSLAVSTVLRAKPDGYTLLGTTGADFILAPEMIGSARYQPEDFKFVGVVGTSDFILLSSKKLPIATMSDLIAYSRKPGAKELTLAHWGFGSSPHIVGSDFQTRIGLKFLEVPYKGAAPVVTDLLGGHIDLAFAPLGGGTLGLIETGQVTALAIASAKRHPALPNVPTVSETLGSGEFEYSIWSGLFAPPGTPGEVVARLTEAVNAWVKSDENEMRISTNASGRLYPMTTEESAAFFKTESEKFRSVSRRLSSDRQ